MRFRGSLPQGLGACRGHLSQAGPIPSADVHRAPAIRDEQCEPGHDGYLHRRRLIESIREGEKRLALIEYRGVPDVAERRCRPAMCRERDELQQAPRHLATLPPRGKTRGPRQQRAVAPRIGACRERDVESAMPHHGPQASQP
jgi:hypothetical protein